MSTSGSVPPTVVPTVNAPVKASSFQSLVSTPFALSSVAGPSELNIANSPVEFSSSTHTSEGFLDASSSGKFKYL